MSEPNLNLNILNENFFKRTKSNFNLSKNNESKIFFKLCLYQNIESNIFLITQNLNNIIYNLIEKNNKISFFKFLSLFFYPLFLKKIIPILNFETDKLRDTWIISNLNLIDVKDLKKTELVKYFQNLEDLKLQQYILNLNQNSNWLKKEYNKFRLNLIVTSFKKNINLILFWILILLVTIFFFIFSANENSYTLGQQLKLWIHYLLGKTN